MRTTLKITLVAVLLAIIPSCGKDPGFTPSRDFVVPIALARVVNAVADGPTLFYSVGNTQLAPLSFLSTSVFTQVLPEINLELDVLYDVTGLPNIWVQDELIRVPLDDEFTVIFTGTLENPTLIRYIDEPFVSNDELRLRIANAAGGFDSRVDVTLSQQDITIYSVTLDMGTVSDPVQLPLGNYDVTVSDSASGDLLWQSDDEVLDFGFNDLFMLTDNTGPSVASEPVRLIRVFGENITSFANDQIMSAYRFTNLMSAFEAVDLFLDGELVEGNISYGDTTDYVIVPNGVYIADIVQSDDPTNVVVDNASISVTPGQFINIVTTNNGPIAAISSFVDERRSPPFELSINVVSGHHQFESLDVYFLSPDETVNSRPPVIFGIPPIPIPGSFVPTAAPPLELDIVITPAVSETTLGNPIRVNLELGRHYSLFIGDPVSEDEEIRVFLEDDFLNPD